MISAWCRPARWSKCVPVRDTAVSLYGVGGHCYLAFMAEAVFLEFITNGEAVVGDSTQTSLDREGKIECLSYSDSVRTAREKGSGMATGRRVHEPVCIRKRIDQSSPILARSLCNNEVVSGTFRFYRPSPAGDGTTEQFFTVNIEEGRIASIRRVSPYVIDPASASDPPTEEVTFVFNKIRWTYEIDGKEHEDSWKDS